MRDYKEFYREANGDLPRIYVDMDGVICDFVLAAKRANIKEIILSSHNKKDIQEINPKYLKGLKFIYVDSMKDVISNSIINRKVTNPKLI